MHNLIESVDGLVEAAPGELKKFQPAYVTYNDGRSVNVIGFSEVYWQPITDGYIESNGGNLPVPIVTWAHSIATRLLSADGGRSTSALAGWRAAIENLERLLLLLGKLVGLLGKDATKALHAVTTKFLGDVQMYAESDQIRQEVNGRFFGVVARVDDFADQTRKNILARLADPLFQEFSGFQEFAKRDIYVVAHSEGTVVAYNSLVQAQMIRDGLGGYPDDEHARASEKHGEVMKRIEHNNGRPDRSWLDKVSGLVTLGSPLDKHYFIWSSRFRKHQLTKPPARKIPWLNFYDTNDPVAYALTELKEPDPGQKTTDANRMFDVTDLGFERYPVPGAAHVEYWADRAIYDQIVHLMDLSEDKPEFPGSIGWVQALRLPVIWLGYPIVRAFTFVLGLYFLNRLLHFGGPRELGWLSGVHDWIALQPLPFGSWLNFCFWLTAPVLVMKLLALAEQGMFFEIHVSRWARWVLSVVWLAIAVVICLGLQDGSSGSSLTDLMGYLFGVAVTVLGWKLHTAVHRGLIQLWYYTAQA